MQKLEIFLDDAVFGRARAYASAHRIGIEDLVRDYLSALTMDLATIALPCEATRPAIHMLAHQDRDMTVRYLKDGGWSFYERPMPGFVFDYCRHTAGLFIDVGANTGYYSLLAAVASARNRVLAFEPDPLVREFLLRNITANDLTPRIEVEDAAASDASGSATLYVPAQDHGLLETSSSLESRFKPRHAAAHPVRTITIDDRLAASADADFAVSAVKIDVAGHEAAVLTGARRTVARHRPVIFLEILEHADAGLLSRFLADNNYLDVPLRDAESWSAVATASYQASAWNHAFVPGEKLSSFLTLRRGSA